MGGAGEMLIAQKWRLSVISWGLGVAAGDEREGVSMPPLMIVPLANARFTPIKGGYPNVSLRLMLWRKEEKLRRKDRSEGGEGCDGSRSIDDRGLRGYSGISTTCRS